MCNIRGCASDKQHHRQADVIHQLGGAFDKVVVDHAALFKPYAEKEHHKNRCSDIEGKEKSIEGVMKQNQFSKNDEKTKARHTGLF